MGVYERKARPDSGWGCVSLFIAAAVIVFGTLRGWWMP